MTLIVITTNWSRTSLTAAPLSWCGWTYRGSARAALIEKLSAEPGKDLVIVRYGHAHRPSDEYVYNRADIENADIVWAREMHAAANRILRTHFHDRRVWLFEPDIKPPKLTEVK
jgi:hypothetical protein